MQTRDVENESRREGVQLANVPGAVEWPDLRKSHKETVRDATWCWYIQQKGRGLYTRDTCSYVLRVSKVLG